MTDTPTTDDGIRFTLHLTAEDGTTYKAEFDGTFTAPDYDWEPTDDQLDRYPSWGDSGRVWYEDESRPEGARPLYTLTPVPPEAKP